jgi:hypothetical protein
LAAEQGKSVMKLFPASLLAVSASVIVSLPAFAEEASSSWVDRLAFYGDLRLRYEDIDEQGDPDAARDRERGRARIGLKADVSPNVKLIMGLATGGDNPVSRNVTGDGGFTTKEIGIELMYVDWQATDDLSVYAGKMKNPLFRAGGVPLIWDGDLNPEGLAASFASGMFFANAGIFSVEERSGQDDSALRAIQGGIKTDIGEFGKITAGLGYFEYTNTIGNEPFYDGNPSGNSVDADGNYLYAYKNTAAFAQFDTKLGDWPFQVYAHYTVNNEVDVEDTAYAFGAKLGSAKKQGSQQASYTFQDIEADSVIGTFNDSDFGGGGTDSSGHMIKYKYMLRDHISVGGTLFINEIDRFQGTAHDFDRLQIDVEFKFN